MVSPPWIKLCRALVSAAEALDRRRAYGLADELKSLLDGLPKTEQDVARRYIEHELREHVQSSDLHRALVKQLGLRNGKPSVAGTAASAPASRTPQRSTDNDYGLIGRSEEIEGLRARMDKIVVAPVPVPILILGETGTGKELVARALHEAGPRAAKHFVAVNCTAFAEGLLESEFFGHVKGTFTGAVSDRPGLFQAANGGTLFLDEIGEVSLELQKKLLRVIQEGEVRPVGSSTNVKVNVHIVAATHKDLHAEIQAGRFREDLYYRIKVLELRMPPLRARRGDVLLLARTFLDRMANQLEQPALGLSTEAERLLMRYGWPGNVRELENEMRRLAVLVRGVVEIGDLSEPIQSA